MKPKVRIYFDVESWKVDVTDNYETLFFGFIRRKTIRVFTVHKIGMRNEEYKEFYFIAREQALKIAKALETTVNYSDRAEKLNLEEELRRQAESRLD